MEETVTMIAPSSVIAYRVIDRNSTTRTPDINATLESLSIDSVDKVRIALEIEQELNIDIDDDCITHWETVGDILRDIRNLTP